MEPTQLGPINEARLLSPKPTMSRETSPIYLTQLSTRTFRLKKEIESCLEINRVLSKITMDYAWNCNGYNRVVSFDRMMYYIFVLLHDYLYIKEVCIVYVKILYLQELRDMQI
jgi:hypothetical protein